MLGTVWAAACPVPTCVHLLPSSVPLATEQGTAEQLGKLPPHLRSACYNPSRSLQAERLCLSQCILAYTLDRAGQLAHTINKDRETGQAWAENITQGTLMYPAEKGELLKVIQQWHGEALMTTLSL